jgi:hypothetical protein
MLASVKNYVYVIILHIFMQLIFFKYAYDCFFFIKNKNILCTADLRFSCSFRFTLLLFYELLFLTNYVTYPK